MWLFNHSVTKDIGVDIGTSEPGSNSELVSFVQAHKSLSHFRTRWKRHRCIGSLPPFSYVRLSPWVTTNLREGNLFILNHEEGNRKGTTIFHRNAWEFTDNEKKENVEGHDRIYPEGT